MIKTATQLKAKIRNVSGGDSKTAMTMMRRLKNDRRGIMEEIRIKWRI